MGERNFIFFSSARRMREVANGRCAGRKNILETKTSADLPDKQRVWRARGTGNGDSRNRLPKAGRMNDRPLGWRVDRLDGFR